MAETASTLTEYEVLAIMDTYPRRVGIDETTGHISNRLQYEEDRVLVFESRQWLTCQTADERREIVHEFLRMVAHHQVAESHTAWSPAHVGYTVRTYRALKSPYMNSKAEQLDRWARSRGFSGSALEIYEAACL